MEDIKKEVAPKVVVQKQPRKKLNDIEKSEMVNLIFDVLVLNNFSIAQSKELLNDSIAQLLSSL